MLYVLEYRFNVMSAKTAKKFGLQYLYQTLFFETTVREEMAAAHHKNQDKLSEKLCFQEMY